MRLIFRMLLTLGLACPLAHAADDLGPPARWSISLLGRSTNDSLSSSETVGTSLGLDLHKNFSDDLYGHFRGLVVLETGTSSSLFTDEFQPNSRILLVDARLQWAAIGPLSLTFGALEQDYLESPLIINGDTFPALLARLRTSSGPWYLESNSQGAIPTGPGLTLKSTGKEPTPELFTETGVVGIRKSEFNFAEFKASYFDFLDLTHGMAQDSRFYGNSVAGIADSSTFVYPFQEFELSLTGALPLSQTLTIVAAGDYVQNPQAPAGTNSGYYTYLGFSLDEPQYRLRPIAEYYNNRSDASPAFYSARDWGHNNRRGFGGTVWLSLKKPSLDLALSARNTRLIDEQPFQRDDFQYYDFTIGLPYAPL